jgi:threonine/homoserine/homoserine lactone efflux protein
VFQARLPFPKATVDPKLLLAFWGVTFLLIVVPGPDWAFTLAAGARDRVVLPAVAGLVVGYSLLTVLVAVGVGALVARSPLVLTTLTAVGACYLVYVGTSVLRHPRALHVDDGDGDAPDATGTRRTARTGSAHPASTAAIVSRGVGVSGLNPKGLLIFVALLPQFTDPRGRWPATVQLGTLGLVFVVTCGAFYTLVGHSARAILGAKPAAARLVSQMSGAAMIVIGLLLLVERTLVDH